MSWRQLSLVGFDTETTGIDPATDRIVSAALVYRTPGSCGVTTPTSWLIDPGVPIPPAAFEVHGLSAEYLRVHGQPPALALEQIATQLSAALSQGMVLVAFNACFDLAIMDAELARCGLPGLAERLGHPVGPVIDPLVLDRALDRFRRGKRTLGAMCQEYGVTSGELHEATSDVVATLDLLPAIAGRYGEIAEMEAGDLHAWQVKQHREWAVDFNAYLSARGRCPDVPLTWP